MDVALEALFTVARWLMLAAIVAFCALAAFAAWHDIVQWWRRRRED